MSYPCSKASFGGSAFASVDDRTVVSGRSTSVGATVKVSDNTGKDTGTVRNLLTAGTLVSKGGRDSSGSTRHSGY
jgi:hypothetical protein